MIRNDDHAGPRLLFALAAAFLVAVLVLVVTADPAAGPPHDMRAGETTPPVIYDPEPQP